MNFFLAARRPPPGFGNLSAAQPQYPSSVSSVINPLLTADLTAGKSFLQQSATNMPGSNEVKPASNSGIGFPPGIGPLNSGNGTVNSADTLQPSNGEHLVSNPAQLPSGSLTDLSKLQATTVLPHLPTVGNFPELGDGAEQQDPSRLLTKLMSEEAAVQASTQAKPNMDATVSLIYILLTLYYIFS